MPRRSPFTRLCQAAASLHQPRADLHIHTTASDGDFTPSQIVVHARNAQLGAIAITDHDTTSGLTEARAVRFETRNVEILGGVEISTRFEDHGYHLLAYGFDEGHAPLQALLADIRQRRRLRFQAFLDSLASDGIVIPPHLLTGSSDGSAIGRRNLAKLLVAAGYANTLQLALVQHILPRKVPISHSVSIDAAIAAVHAAGGVTSLAHPPSEFDLHTLRRINAIGLDAVEANCPSVGYERSLELTEWAKSLGMLVTAGSDYHGGSQTLGSRTLAVDQLPALRERAASNAARFM